MTAKADNAIIGDLEALRALYPEPVGAALIKEIDYISPHYRAFIEAAPFMVLATCGPEGLDCSPRGDGPGFVRVRDERTLLVPDRRGNNRLDSLSNIVRDPRLALLFLVPGVNETLRVNGRAVISADAELCASLQSHGKTPRCVLVVTAERVYFQCSKALVRSRLWDPSAKLAANTLPSAGEILAALSGGEIGGEAYDRAQPERLKATLW